MELQSSNKKPLYTREGNKALICWNERKETYKDENNRKMTLYRYSYIRVPFPFTYSSIVSAIVKSEYDEDRMQAVINNYLANPEDEEHAAEFTAMQNWRAEAKEVAHEVLNTL